VQQIKLVSTEKCQWEPYLLQVRLISSSLPLLNMIFYNYVVPEMMHYRDSFREAVMHYSFREGVMHYSFREGVMHYSFREGVMHYSSRELEGVMHYY
jgi:hypothetical protein